MANKRRFKKNIDALCGSICAQLLFIGDDYAEIPADVINRNINRILSAAKKAKDDANHYPQGEDRISGKADKKEKAIVRHNYIRSLFNEIKNEFSKELEAALKDFNENLPESVKSANKASL